MSPYSSAARALLALATAALVGSAGGETLRADRPDRLDAIPDAGPLHRAAAGHRLDLSGHTRIGKASYYARRFAGRRMADGTRMDPEDDNAASKTLPLGTRARVTNLETGRSTEVTIQDRGPYAKGRILDLSPSKARAIGITRRAGVATVEVAPIAVPQPDGSVKPGAALRER